MSFFELHPVVLIEISKDKVYLKQKGVRTHFEGELYLWSFEPDTKQEAKPGAKREAKLKNKPGKRLVASVGSSFFVSEKNRLKIAANESDCIKHKVFYEVDRTIVADIDISVSATKYLLQNYKAKWQIVRPHIIINCTENLNDIEEVALKEVALSAGGQSIRIIKETERPDIDIIDIKKMQYKVIYEASLKSSV